MRLSDLRTTGFLAVVRRELRPFFGELRRLYFNKLWGMDIAPNCRISFSAKLDKSYPVGLHVGESTAINFGACVLTHDYPRAGFTWIPGSARNVISARTALSCQGSKLAIIVLSRWQASS